MSLDNNQKEKIARLGSDLLQAFIKGASKKKKKPVGPMRGIPTQPPKKDGPGCGGCD